MKIRVFPKRYCINAAIKKLLDASMDYDVFKFKEDSLVDYLPDWIFDKVWEPKNTYHGRAIVSGLGGDWYIDPVFFEVVEE